MTILTHISNGVIIQKDQEAKETKPFNRKGEVAMNGMKMWEKIELAVMLILLLVGTVLAISTLHGKNNPGYAAAVVRQLHSEAKIVHVKMDQGGAANINYHLGGPPDWLDCHVMVKDGKTSFDTCEL